MNTRPKDVPSIFGEALEIASKTERKAYLERACGGDADLLQHPSSHTLNQCGPLRVRSTHARR